MSSPAVRVSASVLAHFAHNSNALPSYSYDHRSPELLRGFGRGGDGDCCRRRGPVGVSSTTCAVAPERKSVKSGRARTLTQPAFRMILCPEYECKTRAESHNPRGGSPAGGE